MYIVDIIVISILFYLIISTALMSKHYMDEATSIDKSLVEKLHYMLKSLIALLLSMIFIIILAVYICVKIYVSERADYFYTSLFAFKTLFSY